VVSAQKPEWNGDPPDVKRSGIGVSQAAAPVLWRMGAAAVFLRLMDIRYYELRSYDIKDYRTTGQTRDQAG